MARKPKRLSRLAIVRRLRSLVRGMAPDGIMGRVIRYHGYEDVVARHSEVLTSITDAISACRADAHLAWHADNLWRAQLTVSPRLDADLVPYFAAALHFLSDAGATHHEYQPWTGPTVEPEDHPEFGDLWRLMETLDADAKRGLDEAD